MLLPLCDLLYCPQAVWSVPIMSSLIILHWKTSECCLLSNTWYALASHSLPQQRLSFPNQSHTIFELAWYEPNIVLYHLLYSLSKHIFRLDNAREFPHGLTILYSGPRYVRSRFNISPQPIWISQDSLSVKRVCSHHILQWYCYRFYPNDS